MLRNLNDECFFLQINQNYINPTKESIAAF